MFKILAKYDKLLLTAISLLPWLTLLFMDKRTVKRFSPAALVICFIVFIESIIAHKQKWWLFYKKLIPNMIGELPLITGPFFVGTLWILRFTFGNFLKYFAVNFIIDFFFTLAMTDWLRRLGFASLIRMKKYQLLIIFLSKATFLYLFQLIWDKTRKPHLYRQ